MSRVLRLKNAALVYRYGHVFINTVNIYWASIMFQAQRQELKRTKEQKGLTEFIV